MVEVVVGHQQPPHHMTSFLRCYLIHNILAGDLPWYRVAEVSEWACRPQKVSVNDVTDKQPNRFAESRSSGKIQELELIKPPNDGLYNEHEHIPCDELSYPSTRVSGNVPFGTDDNRLCSASPTWLLNISLLVRLGRCGETEWCNMEYIFLVSTLRHIHFDGRNWSRWRCGRRSHRLMARQDLLVSCVVSRHGSLEHRQGSNFGVVWERLPVHKLCWTIGALILDFVGDKGDGSRELLDQLGHLTDQQLHRLRLISILIQLRFHIVCHLFH